jgi:hypothetical protein
MALLIRGLVAILLVAGFTAVGGSTQRVPPGRIAGLGLAFACGATGGGVLLAASDAREFLPIALAAAFLVTLLTVARFVVLCSVGPATLSLRSRNRPAS